MQRFVEKLGSNFIVAAFAPSLAFVTAAMVLFGPIIPPRVLARLTGTFNPLNQEGLVLLLLTIVIGFTLSSLNTPIYKMLEGYFLLERVPLLKKRQQEKAAALRKQIEAKQSEIEEERQKGKSKDTAKLSELKAELYDLDSRYHTEFPLSDKQLLPTSFGNILRAAEVYANDRYGIDAVVLWPRLVHVIPDKYYEKIDQSNNGLAFLINCSLLSLLLSFSLAVAAVYEGIMLWCRLLNWPNLLYFNPIDLQPYIYLERSILYLVGSGTMLAGAYGFYWLTLPILAEYGSLVCSAFDLFRFDLLAQLKQGLPLNSGAEHDLWRLISEFTALGDPTGMLKLEYQTAANSSGEGNSNTAPSSRRYSARKAKRSSPKGTRRSKR